MCYGKRGCVFSAVNSRKGKSIIDKIIDKILNEKSDWLETLINGYLITEALYIYKIPLNLLVSK